jgi:hypothetical protein
MEKTGGKAKVGERAYEARLFKLLHILVFKCEFNSMIELQLVVDTVKHSQRLVPAQSGRAPARLVVQSVPKSDGCTSFEVLFDDLDRCFQRNWL